MALPRFEYLAPTTIEETLSLMAGSDRDLAVVAGGTEITNHLRHRLIRPTHVLSLKNVRDLSGMRLDGGEFVIGSMTTVREVALSPAVALAWKAVSWAAQEVAAPPIQNVGTIGGNLLQNTRCFQYNQSEIVRKASGPCMKTGGPVCLVTKGSDRCRSVYQGDMAPALIACGARVKLARAGSSRAIPLEEMFSGSGQAPFNVGKDELLTEIRIPVPAGRHYSSYKKLRLRSSLDYPLASAAACLTTSFDGAIETARLVIGACGPCPVVVTAVGDVLIGNKPDNVHMVEAGEAVSKVGEPINNLLVPGSYRRRMFKTLAMKAVNEALRDLMEERS